MRCVLFLYDLVKSVNIICIKYTYKDKINEKYKKQYVYIKPSMNFVCYISSSTNIKYIGQAIRRVLQ